jgi:hypothetical protein
VRSHGAVIIEHTGLQASPLTWAIAVGLLLFWALSLPLLLRIRGGWEQVLMSLGGLAWVGFGVGIVFRFFLLVYDAEAFASPSTKLVKRPPEVVNLALAAAGVYWVCVVAAALATRFFPVPRPLVTLVRRPEAIAKRAIVPISVVSSICVMLSLLPATPAALVTPLSLLGSMWVIPATLVWVGAFRGEAVSKMSLAITLAPGVLRAVLSPYREHVLILALVILVAAIFTGRRMRLAVVVPVATLLVLGSTIVITTYRQVMWMEVALDRAISRVSLAQWEKQPRKAPWTEVLRRFHSFDSLLLTVDLVPDRRPFSERNMLLEGFTRGLIPRLIDPSKRTSDEGRQFQILIWSFDNDPTRKQGTVSIAPSMPGSLYWAGGLLLVAAGATLWGLFISFLDRFKTEINSPMAAGLQVLWATQALGGIERDYAAAFANLTQTLVVLLIVCFMLGRGPRPQGPAQA